MISGSYPAMPDGVGDYCYNLLAHLRAAAPDLDLTLLTSCLPEITPIPGVRILPVIDRWSMSRLRQIVRICREVRPDVVHIQYPSSRYGRHIMPNLLPVVLRAMGHRRIVVTLHGFGLYTPLGKIRLALPAVCADRVITVSQHIRNAVVKFFGLLRGYIEPKLCDVIYIGANIVPVPCAQADRYRIRRKLGIAPATTVMGYFGFINDGKGFEELLAACHDCISDGLDVVLLLIASLDPRDRYQGNVLAQIDRLGLERNIRITGYLTPEDVSRHLQTADLAALPFNYGASTKRTTLIAALGHGLPTITTADPSLPEIFRDGENVVLVPPRDHKALAAAMARLVRDADLRRSIASRTPALAAHFDWREIARRHADTYRGLRARAGRGRGA